MPGANQLDKADLVRILQRIAAEIDLRKDELSRLDTEIGDGDHGFSMAKGFNSVADKLADFAQLPIGGLLKKTGFELIKSIGGAAGAVFGTLFTGQASYYEKNLADQQIVTLQDLARMHAEAISQIKSRGGAEAGDKTMLDALEPAVAALEEAASRGSSLADAFSAAARAAKDGVESTREMVAKHGRAKNLAERALGFVDPGAVCTALIFEVMAEYTHQKQNE